MRVSNVTFKLDHTKVAPLVEEFNDLARKELNLDNDCHLTIRNITSEKMIKIIY